jgi:hypothetical protein
MARIRRAEIFGRAGDLILQTTIRHSLFAIRYLLPSRLADLPTSQLA